MSSPGQSPGSETGTDHRRLPPCPDRRTPTRRNPGCVSPPRPTVPRERRPLWRWAAVGLLGLAGLGLCRSLRRAPTRRPHTDVRRVAPRRHRRRQRPRHIHPDRAWGINPSHAEGDHPTQRGRILVRLAGHRGITTAVQQAPYTLSVNYTEHHSGHGRYEFTNQTTDFAVSDIGYVGNTDTAPPSFALQLHPDHRGRHRLHVQRPRPDQDAPADQLHGCASADRTDQELERPGAGGRTIPA